MVRHARSTLATAAPAALSAAALLLAWEGWVRLGHVSPRVLASPSEIVSSSLAVWPGLMRATAVTAYEGFVGFALATAAGVVVGIALYRWRLLHDALYPLLAAAQTLPLITIAPLFVIWFGFEPSGKIAIVTVFSMFPIVIQTYRGLLDVPEFYADVALTCGGTRRWTLWHVQLRVAARQIFGGLRISAAYTFATATTAEYLGARSGLGIWLQAAFNSFRTPLIFAATVVIVALTALLLALISGLEILLLGTDRDE